MTKQAAQQPTCRGSILDADPPAQGVNIAGRMTIEMAFSKLKALLRAAAARTMPDLWQAIANALKCFSPDECQNYLAAAGYDAT